MSNSLTSLILKASLDDVSWIVNLAYNQMNNHLEYAYNAPFNWETWENEMRGIILSDNKNNGVVNIFQTIKNNENIGFWWITPYNDHLWIDAFVITPIYQNRGIGSILIRQISAYFQDFYPINTRMELGVQNNNNQAISFYKKMGFGVQPDGHLESFQTLRMVKLA